MRFAFSNRIKASSCFQVSHALASRELFRPRFQLMHLLLAKSVKAVVAFKLLDHWLANSYSLSRFQVMRFLLANIRLKQQLLLSYT